MKCNFIGCPNTEDIKEVTIAPGTTVKLCPTCTASEFSMCDQPGDGLKPPLPSRKDDMEYFDNHAV